MMTKDNREGLKGLLFVNAVLIVSCVFWSYAMPDAAQETANAEAVTSMGDSDSVGTSPAPRGPILKVLKRRQRGLTVRNISRILQDMKTQGELVAYVSVASDGSQEVNVSALAVEVIDRLTQENPKGWIDWENIDWDAIIQFVERIIELIMKIIPLFVDTTTTLNVESVATLEASHVLAA